MKEVYFSLAILRIFHIIITAQWQARKWCSTSIPGIKDGRLLVKVLFLFLLCLVLQFNIYIFLGYGRGGKR